MSSINTYYEKKGMLKEYGQNSYYSKNDNAKKKHKNIKITKTGFKKKSSIFTKIFQKNKNA